MSSFLLWAQQQEISTSHTSERQRASKLPFWMCSIERLGGRLDCLFGGSCVNPYEHPTLRLDAQWTSWENGRGKYRFIQPSSWDVAHFIYPTVSFMRKCNVICFLMSFPQPENMYGGGSGAQKIHMDFNLNIKYLTIRLDDHPFSPVSRQQEHQVTFPFLSFLLRLTRFSLSL